MSRKDEEALPKDWTEAVRTYLNLPTGETTLQIVEEPYLRRGKWGIRLNVPTHLGIWPVSVEGRIAGELKKWNKKLGQLKGSTLTVVRTGQGRDTRYDIKNFVPANREKPVETPPPNQTMLDVTPEERAALEEMRNRRHSNSEKATNPSKQPSTGLPPTSREVTCNGLVDPVQKMRQTRSGTAQLQRRKGL